MDEDERSLTPLNGPRCTTGSWVTPDRQHVLAIQTRFTTALAREPPHRKRQLDDCCGLGHGDDDVHAQRVANIAVAIRGHTDAGHTAYTISVAVTGHTDAPGHTAYHIVTEINGHTAFFNGVAETHHRFSDFVELHEALRRDEPAVVFRLPREFPLSRAIFNGSAQLKEERRLGYATHAGLSNPGLAGPSRRGVRSPPRVSSTTS